MRTLKSAIDHCLKEQMNPEKASNLLKQNGYDVDSKTMMSYKQKHLARKRVRYELENSIEHIGLRLFDFKANKSRLAAKVKAQRIRSDLLLGARVARQLGLTVEKSEFNNRVSSYYVFDSNRKKYRISDHDIPYTLARDARWDGNFDGSADIYASDSKIRRKQWWIRAYALLLAGRTVPQEANRA